MAKMTIEVQVDSDSMGHGWVDDYAACTEYADWLSEQLETWADLRFPDGRKVEVIVTALNQTGCNYLSVHSDEEDVDNERIAEEVKRQCNALWDRFCAIVHDDFPHLVDF